MSFASLETATLLAVLIAAGWYLLRRSLHRHRKAGPAPACGSCRGCNVVNLDEGLSEKEGAKCAQVTPDIPVSR